MTEACSLGDWDSQNGSRDRDQVWRLHHEFEASVLSQSCGKTHAEKPELHLLYQSVYQSPCTVFHFLVNTTSAADIWTSPPAAVYCRLFAAYTALGFLRDTIPRSFQCWFNFIPAQSHAAEDRLSTCWRSCSKHAAIAAPDHPQKANNWSCSFQKWHPHRLGCYIWTTTTKTTQICCITQRNQPASLTVGMSAPT